MTHDRIEALEVLANSGQQGKKSEAIRELSAEVRKLQRRRDPIKGPTLPEVLVAASKMKWVDGLAEEFYDRYRQVGWVYGRHKLPIVDFEAAMRNFKRGKDKFDKPRAAGIGAKYGVG